MVPLLQMPPEVQQHQVKLLNAGVGGWNLLREDKPFLPSLTRAVVEDKVRSEWAFSSESDRLIITLRDLTGVNLSDADLRGAILEKWMFRRADLSGAYLTGASIIESDFSRADFRGAQLEGFNARGANLSEAKFGVKAIDYGPDYPTIVQRTNLTGVDLSFSDLFRARLAEVDLSRVKLDGSRLWRAKLFRQPLPDIDPASKNEIQSYEVESVAGLSGLRESLLAVYGNLVQQGLVAFYFRGEPCSRSLLHPTVTRRRLRRFERDLLIDLKTQFPAAFTDCEYAIDELAIARHFELPSRLLDISRNPLVALYWATGEAESQHRGFGCEEVDCSGTCSCVHQAEQCEGKLHVFAIPTELVCPYDSDRVSIVANFARLPVPQQERLLTKRTVDVDGMDKDEWSSPRNSMDESMKTLLHNIQREKPYFAPQIDLRDLFKVLVVEPRRSFDRVRAQSGAFFLSAFHERFEGDQVRIRQADTKLYDHFEVAIPAGAKKQEIREELEWFGISQQTLYADVESAADSVTRRFQAIVNRRNRESVDNG